MTQKAGARVRAADGLGVAEIHAHTLASDGMVSATDLVRAAAAIGVNVLCITEPSRTWNRQSTPAPPWVSMLSGARR
jgi:hypothetical protein